MDETWWCQPKIAAQRFQAPNLTGGLANLHWRPEMALAVNCHSSSNKKTNLILLTQIH
jgi:hypothetical protein